MPAVFTPVLTNEYTRGSLLNVHAGLLPPQGSRRLAQSRVRGGPSTVRELGVAPFDGLLVQTYRIFQFDLHICPQQAAFGGSIKRDGLEFYEVGFRVLNAYVAWSMSDFPVQSVHIAHAAWGRAFAWRRSTTHHV